MKRLGCAQQKNGDLYILYHVTSFFLSASNQHTLWSKVKKKPTWNETPQVLLLLLFSINDTAELSSSELDPGSLLSSTLKGSGAAPTARRVGTGRRLWQNQSGQLKSVLTRNFCCCQDSKKNSGDALGCYFSRLLHISWRKAKFSVSHAKKLISNGDGTFSIYMVTRPRFRPKSDIRFYLSMGKNTCWKAFIQNRSFVMSRKHLLIS